MPDCTNRVTEAFHGSNGVASRPGLIQSTSGHTLFEHEGKNDPDPYQVEHDELFAAVAAGEYKFANAKYGAESTFTAILGRMATYSGQVLDWDEALASEVSVMPERFAFDADPPDLPDADGQYPIPEPGVTMVI